MFNLSDEIFMETIIYLQNFGLDYFEFIRTNLDKFDEVLLEVSSYNSASLHVHNFHIVLAPDETTWPIRPDLPTDFVQSQEPKRNQGNGKCKKFETEHMKTFTSSPFLEVPWILQDFDRNLHLRADQVTAVASSQGLLFELLERISSHQRGASELCEADEL